MPLSPNRRPFSRAAAAASLTAMLAACGGGSTSLPTPAVPNATGGSVGTQSVAVAAAAAGAASPNWKQQCQSDKRRCTARVLLISIDGMHDVDLQRFVASHPNSTLGKLSRTGVTYANAHAPVPTDSFPGLLAMTTGGHPASTGVYYEVSYDRSLYPPKSNCTGAPGTVTAFDETIDVNPNSIDGGADPSDTTGKSGINPANLTEQLAGGVCTPVYPHNYLRVNTIFEAVKAHGGRTAWSDKEQSYEMLNGPSGHGVDDFYNREIAAGGTTANLAATEAYDDGKVAAILNEIDGKSARGIAGAGVPAIFGMNFQAVSVGQKLLHIDNANGPRGGYTDAYGTPTPALEQAIEHTDASLGLFVAELRKRGLAESTLIIVSAKHGQTPIDYALRRGIAGAGTSFQTLLTPYTFAASTTDDLALLWLTDRSAANLNGAQTALENAAFKTALGYESGALYTHTHRPDGWGEPGDSRYPDFAVKVDVGVIYTGGTKIAEHGGFSDNDSHVALLVSRPPGSDAGAAAAPLAAGCVVRDPVQTAQIAPTILQSLAIDPHQLQAVGREGTAVLPGLHI